MSLTSEQQKRWLRHRFEANEDDYRPIKFPPPGPYWCTGYGDGHSIVVACLPPEVSVTEYWPEAANVDTQEVAEISFTDRFPKPDWWQP